MQRRRGIRKEGLPGEERKDQQLDHQRDGNDPEPPEVKPRQVREPPAAKEPDQQPDQKGN